MASDWTEEDQKRVDDILERFRARQSIDPEEQDYKLSIMLLTGVWTQEGMDPKKKKADRYPAKRYLQGDLEKQAREAIGRLLRSSAPLDSGIRYYLAELFDGLGPHLSFDAAPMPRQIVFQNRSSGEPGEVALRDLHLVSDYEKLIGEGMLHKTAIAQVCEKYGVSPTTVKDARKRREKTVKKLLDRPT
jgi:hypothetical protein